MDSRDFIKGILVSSFLLALLLGCAAPVRIATEPPPFPDGFLRAKWGGSIEEVKKAIEMDGLKWFQESTEKLPHALYASGTSLNYPAIFTYFFTPKSKRLYRVDVTFNELSVYEKARSDLIEKFKSPSYFQKDVDHWSWKDASLIVLQKDAANVQMSFSNGTFLILNHKEGNGLLGK